jgi:O-antigen ligase
MQFSFQGDERHTLISQWWGAGVCLWLASMLLAGGISTPVPAMLSFQSVLSAGVALVAAWRLRAGFPTWVSAAGAGLIVLVLLTMWAQLLPLPPAVWQSFPLRDLVAESYGTAGKAMPWLPLNLQPAAGYEALLAFLPAIAGFLAVLTVDPRHFPWLGGTILACALASVLLALLQKYAGPGNALAFYPDVGSGAVTGTFANRNFFAAQLFATIPFIAALAVSVNERWHVRAGVTIVFAVLYMGILLAGLAASGSRAGVLLAMLAVLLTFVFVFRWHRIAHSGVAVLAVFAAVFVISQASMIGLLRLVQRDPLEDYRTTIFAVTLKASKALFPAGSGFGSFASAYQMFETPADIIDPYVNHAHND